MKTESSLQQQSILWAKKSLVICSVGIGAVSLVNLLINRDIFQLWFTWPNGLLLLLLPLSCVLMFVLAYRQLNILKQEVNRKCWLPFVLAIGIFCISFIALAISYYPDIVPNKMTIWQAVSAPESLSFILWGALVVIPTIIAYTAFSYRVFWGKVRALQYY